jgi:hypothetical protein
MRRARVGGSASVWTCVGLVAAGLALAAGCASREKKQACAPAAPGCPKPIVVFAPAVSPEMLDTPSTTFVNQSGVRPAVVERGWSSMTGYYAAPVVQHGPLYFEDEFENVGVVSDACPRGWTWLDFVSIPYCDARWMLNTIAVPVSMVVYPPWQPTCSDGEPGKTPLGLTFDSVPCKQLLPPPFDLECPDQQAAVLTHLSGGPLPATPTPPAPATQPAD